MTRDRFEALVARLENEARKNPGGYQVRVLLLALLGNAYLGLMLALVGALWIALLASIVVLKALAVKLIIVVGFFLWMVLRALWVKIPPPEGTAVRRAEAPKLFELIDGLRKALGAPRLHHVLITDEFNAGVVQAPRLGMFGWPRNYLLLGLPLMKALGTEQFAAVLAHEFGHLARGHGRISNWIYRQRLRWSRLMSVLEASESRGSFLFKPFLDRYAPYFNAFSFPLARANEYDADATSARLTSPGAAAAALTSVNVVGSYLAERYWPNIFAQAHDHPQPNFAPFSGMAPRMTAEIDEASMQTWLSQAMARKTTVDDTHPALCDRLEAMGEAPRLAPPAPTESADRLLGDALAKLTETFDQRWKSNILPAWEERYRQIQEARQRRAELDEKHDAGNELTLQEAYDRATLTEAVGNDADAALEQFRALQQRAPDDAVICLSLGARLLAREDGAGTALIERAMQLDESLIIRCSELMRDYHARNDRKPEAQSWHDRLVARTEIEQSAWKERNQVLLREKFEPHGLTDDVVEQLKTRLRAISGLRRAYLVKKRVAFLSHRPCYVLGFSAAGLFQLHRKKRIAEVMQRIQADVPLPLETLILCVDGDNYRFGRKFRWMRGTRLV